MSGAILLTAIAVSGVVSFIVGVMVGIKWEIAFVRSILDKETK